MTDILTALLILFGNQYKVGSYLQHANSFDISEQCITKSVESKINKH